METERKKKTTRQQTKEAQEKLYSMKFDAPMALARTHQRIEKNVDKSSDLIDRKIITKSIVLHTTSCDEIPLQFYPS